MYRWGALQTAWHGGAAAVDSLQTRAASLLRLRLRCASGERAVSPLPCPPLPPHSDRRKRRLRQGPRAARRGQLGLVPAGPRAVCGIVQGIGPYRAMRGQIVSCWRPTASQRAAEPRPDQAFMLPSQLRTAAHRMPFDRPEACSPGRAAQGRINMHEPEHWGLLQVRNTPSWHSSWANSSLL